MTAGQQPMPIATAATFVAEVGVSAALHSRLDAREPLDNPSNYGINRGYWTIWRLLDGSGGERPAGLRLVIEFVAESVEGAEDHAATVGRRLAGAAAFFAGSPQEPARLLRLARVSVDGYLEQQWDYYHDDDRPASVRFNSSELREFVRRLDATPKATAPRLALGARWYSASVGSQSPLDAYLATWVGLESVGPLLAPYFHPDGPRAACDICRNPPSRRRHRGLAAIDHLILSVAPELCSDGRRPSDLYDLRNEIAHGLRSGEQVERQVASLLPDLQLCLSAGVLVARDGPSTLPVFGWRAALPRDYEPRPSARATVWFDQPLPDHSPYLGEWIEVTRNVTVDRSSLEAETGAYERELRIQIISGARLPEGQAMHRDYVTFTRLGIEFFVTDMESGNPPTRREWRARPMSPAWQRTAKRSPD